MKFKLLEYMPNLKWGWASLFLLLLILNTSSINSQTKFEKIIQQGIEQTLKFDYKNAEKTFQTAISINPLHPAGDYQISQIYLYYFLGSKDEGDFALFNKYSDLALEKLDMLQEDEKNNSAELYYLRGQIETGRAIGFGSTGEMMSAFWASKAAVGAYEDALEMNPKMYEAYTGIGVFNYALSFVPGMLQFAIGITGLSSDKAEGLINLRKGLQCNNIRKYEALFHLTKVYAEYVADFDSSKVMSDLLVKRFPKNELFQYQRAVAFIVAGDLQNAEFALNKVIKISHPKFKMTTSLAYFLKGDIYFRRNQFKKAIGLYKKFIENAVTADFTGIANYRMAIGYLMLKEKHLADKYALRANLGNSDVAEDELASQKGKTLIEDWAKEKFKQTILDENDLFASNFNAIIDRYGNAAEIVDKRFESFRQSILSWAFYNKGKYLEAILTAEKSLKVNLEEETWTQALAALTIAYSNDKLSNKNKCLEYLEIAEEYLQDENRIYVESRINFLKKKYGLLD